MGKLDDFPKRHSTHDIGEAAELAFTVAIDAAKLFLIQQKDRNDYGTDHTIEARADDSMTNVRVHVQLKGTEVPSSADGSVTVQVARTNLNYLLMQPESLYVCYHLPTGRLLVRFVQDVFCGYEHRGKNWQNQNDVTVRFAELFDGTFQRRLHAKTIARSRAARDRRLDWAVTPPDRLPAKLQQAVHQIEVPSGKNEARAALVHLYHSGHDRVISAAFDQFAAVLNDDPSAMSIAYMAEINLGINTDSFDKDRVRAGINLLAAVKALGTMHPASLSYCEGNGWMALGENEKATECFAAAIDAVGNGDPSGFEAECCKNWGSALESLGRSAEARALYERALEHNPDLNEAHFALGCWHLDNGDDAQLALQHLDSMSPQQNSPIPMASVQGRRIEALFKTGDIRGAFREIQALRNQAPQHKWIWPYCARIVGAFGRVTDEAATLAVAFWRAFLREHSDDYAAEREWLLCLSAMRCSAIPSGVSYDEFKRAAVSLIERGDSESALLWDRVGHWAEDDGDWVEAERSYRQAYSLEPERYGYCLGVALVHLDRPAEAIPILLAQAEQHQPDAKSWFQLAIAREGVGDRAGCIAAFRRAVELDETYELAWFNLGGACWNARKFSDARTVWTEATKRFPAHEETRKLLAKWKDFFGDDAPRQ